jgi:hypothetical protein
VRAISYGFIAEAALTAVLAVGGTALVIVGAGSLPSDRTGGSSPGPALESSAAPPVGPPVAETADAGGGTAALPPSAPIGLEIPAVDIATPLIALGRSSPSRGSPGIARPTSRRRPSTGPRTGPCSGW